MGQKLVFICATEVTLNAFVAHRRQSTRSATPVMRTFVNRDRHADLAAVDMKILNTVERVLDVKFEHEAPDAKSADDQVNAQRVTSELRATMVTRQSIAADAFRRRRSRPPWRRAT